MRLSLVALLATLVLWPAAVAADERGEAVRLPESMAVTPDGKTLVFSWRGDLWRAPLLRVTAAERLTFHPAPDTRPHISPDGKHVAFVSTRTGAEQVHLLPLAGGAPRQITMHSEGARVYGWFPDSKAVLIRSKRDHHWRAADRLFRKPLELEAQAELLFDADTGHGAVSPDGRLIAFTREGMGWTRKGYRGDRASQIWLYDLEAKTFRKRSAGKHGELWPMWGRNASTLYYIGDVDGTWNVWRLDIATGKRKQITSHKDDGAVWPAMAANADVIVYRNLFDFHTVRPDEGSAPDRLDVRYVGDPTIDAIDRRSTKRATAVAFTDDAREIAFVAGGDLWVMDTELREPRRVTNTPQEERDPVFSRDFDSLYVVSDAAGQTDVWKMSRADAKKYWWQNDEFTAERVTNDEATEEELRLTPDGKRLAYLKEGSLWSMATDGTDARRHVQGFLGMQWSFSPNGQWIAYAAPDADFNWDVWITAADGSGEPVNVSRHPDNDRSPAWSPDGKILAFSGRRWTEETDLCYVWLRAEDDQTDKRDRTLEKALKKMAARKKKGAKKKAGKGKPAPDAPAAPTGLAGSWRGRLKGPQPLPEDGLEIGLELTKSEAGWTCVIDVVQQFQGTAETFEVDEEAGTFTFAMTTPLGPMRGAGTLEDGKRVRGTWQVEGVMEGTFEVTRVLKEAATADSDAPAKTDAKPKPAQEKPEGAKKKPEEPKPLVIDFEGIADRIKRISIPDGAESDLLWSPDAKTLAFRGSVKGAAGLYSVTFPDKLTPKLMTTARGSHARWLKEGKQIAWLSGGTPATLSSSGKPTTFRFTVRHEVDKRALHGAVFDQAWRTMRDTYYDEAMGNTDWNAIRTKYGAMASECVTASDVSLVINMMLGELNGSHLGFNAMAGAWRRGGWRPLTGHLGCRFDPRHDGPGMRIRDVVRDTPADQARSRRHAGELILSIDGRPISSATNLDRLLTGDMERTITLRVANAEGEERTVSLRPTTYAGVRSRLYEEWIEGTRAAIEKQSGGTVGYLHIRSMNWSSFLRFEAELYKAGHGKDALIIDVRDNGGGFTTDHLLTCLTQPRHAITVPRRGGRGYPQDRMVYAPWSKPVVVLCNQNSFSNAEIFPHAIKTLGRGKIVGVTTAGGVISTGGTTVMGFGSLRLPFRGWYLLNDGEDMELHGCVPHHTVWNEPADFAAGRDRQVEKAVAVAKEEIAAWRARPQPKLRNASTRKGFGGKNK
ncbi:MAG: S41 family peptidase [Planctomycetota bacterium]|nr:S41 family peptidase [Planctomycetota bacterium]